ILANEDEQELRDEALREVGKALALDPENQDALKTLVRLLSSPPKHVPPEVAAEIEDGRTRRRRIAGVAGAGVYVFITLAGIAEWMLGIRDVPTFGVVHLMWLTALAMSLVTAWRPSFLTLFGTFVCAMTACTFVTGVYGSFLVVPSLLAMHAVIFSLVEVS